MGIAKLGNEYYVVKVVFVLCECATYMGECVVEDVEVADLWVTPDGKYIAVLE